MWSIECACLNVYSLKGKTVRESVDPGTDGPVPLTRGQQVEQ